MTESVKGKLLVASPTLMDPNFHRTVVLMLGHEAQGALGVVLNRPSETAVTDALAGWAPLVTGPPVVFVGGPVQPNAAVCLAELHAPVPEGAAEPVLGRLATVDLERDPGELGASASRLRIFAGYAGWGEGQLEAEVEEGAWYVVGSRNDDAFTLDPEGLWRSVLRREGGKLAWVANFPLDPAMN